MSKKLNDCPNCNKAFTPEEIEFQACSSCKFPEHGLGQAEDSLSYSEPPDPYDHLPALYGNDSWMH